MHARLKFRTSEGQDGEERFDSLEAAQQSLMARLEEYRTSGRTIDRSAEGAYSVLDAKGDAIVIYEIETVSERGISAHVPPPPD
jgi:hypothetical protein